jgi:hypothetical protein
MACHVKTNRHDFLAFRLYWDGRESWEGTGLKESPKNRQRMEARAVLISEEMECGSFDYLQWFPDGNKAYLFRLEKKSEDKPRPWVSSIEIGLSGKSRLLCGPDCTTTTPGSFAGTYSRSSRKWPLLILRCPY